MEPAHPRLLEFRSHTRKLRSHLAAGGAFLVLLTIVIAVIGEKRTGRAIYDFTQASPGTKLFLEIVSDWLNYVFYALFLAAGIRGLARRRNDLFRYTLVYLLVQLAAAVLIARALKLGLGRRRPGAHGETPRWGYAKQAFPSGHTTDMACSTSVLSYFLKPVVLRLPLYACLALMAFSRVGLGAHHPFDVVGGAFIGLFSGFVISHLLAAWIARKSAPNSQTDNNDSDEFPG